MYRKPNLIRAALVLVLLLGAVLIWQEQLYAWRRMHPPRVVRREKPAPPPPVRRPATEEERQAAIRSIQAQLDAFRKDDYARAALYQSAALRQQFDSLAEFRYM